MNVKQLRQPLLERINRTYHPERVQQRAETKYNREHREILAPREVTDSRTQRIAHKLHRRHAADDANIVIRTRLHTVETKSAIEVANLVRLKQRQLTAALNRYQRRRWFAHAADAILRRATTTHVVISHRDFKRRNSCSDKVELSDRTNELAERRVFEDSVNQERAGKVNDDEPCS